MHNRHHKYVARRKSCRNRADRAQVTIKRIERNKRKHVTAIHGLENFGAPCPYARARTRTP